jgi:predicted DNA-binding ribbon-helix-helix protein
MEPVTKRSIVVGNHKTSVSLEDEFWHALREVAKARQMRLCFLVAQIKAARPQNNLSSAIRLFLLNHYRTRSLPSSTNPLQSDIVQTPLLS